MGCTAYNRVKSKGFIFCKGLGRNAGACKFGFTSLCQRKGAAYWGPMYEQSDRLVHSLNIPQITVSFRKTQNPELKQITKSFIDGMNAYAKANPEVIDKDKLPILPVTPDDVNLQSLYVFVMEFTGGNELNKVPEWWDMGSID